MAASAVLPSFLIGLAILLVLRRIHRKSSDDVHLLPDPVCFVHNHKVQRETGNVTVRED